MEYSSTQKNIIRKKIQSNVFIESDEKKTIEKRTTELYELLIFPIYRNIKLPSYFMIPLKCFNKFGIFVNMNLFTMENDWERGMRAK